jgi:hypothetical protein
MPRAHKIWLFTNRNVLIFDEAGLQIPEAQSAISCYEVNPTEALRLTNEASEFYLTQWDYWAHAISRRDMQYLLGLRTREMDLAEIISDR